MLGDADTWLNQQPAGIERKGRPGSPLELTLAATIARQDFHCRHGLHAVLPLHVEPACSFVLSQHIEAQPCLHSKVPVPMAVSSVVPESGSDAGQEVDAAELLSRLSWPVNWEFMPSAVKPTKLGADCSLGPAAAEAHQQAIHKPEIQS